MLKAVPVNSTSIKAIPPIDHVPESVSSNVYHHNACLKNRLNMVE
jgi:hypothetical protein